MVECKTDENPFAKKAPEYLNGISGKADMLGREHVTKKVAKKHVSILDGLRSLIKRRRGDTNGKLPVREPLLPACPVDRH
jgi:hypothetical protein